eukprot:TRINITY_DN0_c1_g1_i1.p1 TRINITY_DN0_c1_g1~~TRINITY_DN0_c1_g1_i1.p1  ORF type:complete len:523 (+),score=241.04 TRINITY_DN0_c1_g1_i1:74-1570(+)
MNKSIILLLVLINLIYICSARRLFTATSTTACCTTTGSTTITTYDTTTQFCCNGRVGTLPAGATGQCCGSNPLLTNQVCCNGVVQNAPNGESCCGTTLLAVGQSCCGTRSFTAATQQCCNAARSIVISNTLQCCGTNGMTAGFTCCADTTSFNPNVSPFFDSCCGSSPYNSLTSTCCSVFVTTNGVTSEQFSVVTGLGACCGRNNRLLASNEICCPNDKDANARIVSNTAGNIGCCGSNSFNILTERCCSKTDATGAIVTNVVTKLLSNNLFDQECCFDSSNGASLYYPEFQTCCDNNGVIVPKTFTDNRISCCDRTPYDPDNHVCCNGKVVCGDSCCGDLGYFAATQICCSGFIYDKKTDDADCCVEFQYSRATHVCCAGILQHKRFDGGVCCYDYYYNPANRACCNPPTATLATRNHNGVVSNDFAFVGTQFIRCGKQCCGNSGFYPDHQTCCNGALYENDPSADFRCCDTSIYDDTIGNSICCCASGELSAECDN